MMNVEENIECKFLISKARALRLRRRSGTLRRARVLLAVGMGLLVSVTVEAQEFHISDSIVKATQAIYVEDSIRFMRILNRLMSIEIRDEINDVRSSPLDRLMSKDIREEVETACGLLDELRYMKLIKKHSNEIIQKLAGVYKYSNPISRLLSLTNPPDSIRFDLLGNSSCTLCKARLGDSTAIAGYINEYISFRDREDSEYGYSNLGISPVYYLKVLLSLDSRMAMDIIFNDIQSTRIITLCENTIDSNPQNCIFWNITYLYMIMEAFMMKHFDEPVLNCRFITPLVLLSYPKDYINPYIPGFFKALEEFILREYGYSVTINVPFVVAE